MERSLPERLLEAIIVPGVLVLVGIGFVGVCLRYLFEGRYALFWSEEVIRYGFIWIFWLVSPILIAKGTIFYVDLLTVALPRRVQTALGLLVNAGIVILLGIYTYQGLVMASVNWVQLSTALEVPIGWVYLAIPVGSAGMLVVVLHRSLQLLGIIRTRQEEERGS